MYKEKNKDKKHNCNLNFYISQLQFLCLGMGFFVFLSCGDGVESFDPQLQAQPSISSHITLTWEAVPGAESYRVYRSWWKLFPVLLESDISQTFYQDSELQNNTEYHYQVSAVLEGQEGPLSFPVSATTHPGQVQGVKAEQEGASVKVKWQALQGFSAYWVHRETEAGAAVPKSFFVEGNPPPTEFIDTSPPPGLTSYYFVQPHSENVEYSYGGARFTSLSIPGDRLPTGEKFSTVNDPIPPLDLKARPQSGGVLLSWTDQGPHRSYSLTRRTQNQDPIVLDEGLLSPFYWDGEILPGVPTTYEVRSKDPKNGTQVSSSVMVKGVASVTRPDKAILKFSVPGQPVQQALLQSANRNQSFRGVLILLGQSPENLPNLMAAAGKSQLAVLCFESFNFGTPESPRYLSTQVDPYHFVSVMDQRRPHLSSQFLQAALEAAMDLWPEHLELSTIPLVGWAFSQTDVTLVQVLSQPEWIKRVAVLIHANALEPNTTIPLFSFPGVPQFFLLSGRFDPYSQLTEALAYTSKVSRMAYLNNLIQIHKMPLTVFNNAGKGHAEGLDHPYVAQWLASVYSQISPETLNSWQGREGWTGGYGVEAILDLPWGDGRKAGVKLVGTQISLEALNLPGITWFPSKGMAEMWKKFIDSVPE